MALGSLMRWRHAAMGSGIHRIVEDSPTKDGRDKAWALVISGAVLIAALALLAFWLLGFLGVRWSIPLHTPYLMCFHRAHDIE